MPAPSNPAPASGPGALAKRTDGGPAAKQAISVPTGMPYGDATAMRQSEQAAPLAKDVLSGGDAQPQQGFPSFAGPGFGDPTQMPMQPVTSGAPVGPGPGPEAIMPAGQQQQRGQLTAQLASMLPNDLTGEIASLYQIAQSQGY